MEIETYVTDLHRRLIDAADNGSTDSRATAERMAASLDAATRLVLLDVLSAATSEITLDLAPGSVDLRLRGREVEFVVSQAHSDGEGDNAGASASPQLAEADDLSTSRTTLRLPDAVKSRVDDAAAADGVSVNTWLVRAVTDALNPKHRRAAQRTLRTGDNFTGWAR